MKNLFQAIVFLSVAITGINTVSAQSVKFHSNEPPTITRSAISDGTNTNFQFCITGTLYGCGSASSVQASLSLQGSANTLCFNRGSDGGPVAGQANFNLTSPTVSFGATNGHTTVSICVTVTGSCKGGGMDHYQVTDINLTNAFLLINGVQVSLNKFL